MDKFLLGIFLSALSAPLSLFLPRPYKGRFVFALVLVGSCLVLAGAYPTLTGHGGESAASFSAGIAASGPDAGSTHVENPPIEERAGARSQGHGHHPFMAWAPVFEMDAVSALFASLTAFIVPLVLLFADGYLRRSPPGRGFDSHYFFLPLFTTAMTLLYAAGDSLTFLCLWEIMTGASLLLLLHDRNSEEPVSAGIYYLAAAGIGFGFLLTGFTVASAASGGGLAFRAMAAGLAGNRASSVLVFGLLATGFALKLGLVPLHTWLPRAHPAAPSHVSALMSALMVKAGLYGVIRAAGIAGSCGPWPFALLAVAGGFTAVLAILQAVGARDYKRMLAMSTVENAGIMALALGTGLLAASTGHAEAAFMALAGALMHAVSHGLSKGLAFLGAGALYGACHTRDIEKLGGLGKIMPIATGSALIGSASLCALPPFAGFPGELLILLANLRLMMDWAHSPGLVLAPIVSSVGIAFVGACALSVFSRFFSVAFLGHPRSAEAAAARNPGASCEIPMAVLAVCIAIFGLFPTLFLDLVSGPAEQILRSVSSAGLPAIPATAVKAMTGSAMGSALLAALALLLFTARRIVLSRGTVGHARTWDCAYRGGTPAMQYTSASFSQPLTTLAGPVMGRTLVLQRPEGLFPSACAVETRYHDPGETRVVEPAVRLFRGILDRFSWIQGGDARSYIFYGLAFLVVSLILLLGF